MNQPVVCFKGSPFCENRLIVLYRSVCYTSKLMDHMVICLKAVLHYSSPRSDLSFFILLTKNHR